MAAERLRDCGLALLLAAAPSLAATSGFGPFDAELRAGGAHEQCVRLEAGQGMRYHFEATGEVDFNIHYHRGSAVHYPVKADGARAGDSTFTAPHADVYCLMWERHGDPAVRITGAVQPDAKHAEIIDRKYVPGALI